MLTRSRASVLRALGVTLAGLAVACGGQPAAGPSPIAVPPPGTVAAPLPPGSAHRSGVRVTVPGLPADYVEALLHGGPPNNNPHLLEAWEGGPFKHCVTSGLDPAIVASAARIVSAETGIPQREDGPCNVTWEVRDYSTPAGGAYCAIQHPEGPNVPGPIISATIVIKAGLPPGYFDMAIAVHELGHAIGLGHSPRSEDVMYGRGARETAFSTSERAVIAAVYLSIL